MQLLIMFFILTCISAVFAYLLKYKFEQTLAIACLFMILVTYVCGLFGFMKIGLYICCAVALAGLIICICNVVKWKSWGKEFLFNRILSPGFMVFCLFYLFVCFIHRGRTLALWDEFSHWGRVVKNMYIFNTFGNNPHATTIFMGYPPGASVFQYLWSQLYGFKEPNLYRSINILLFSFMLPVFKNVDRKNIKQNIIVALTLFILPLGFYSTFYNEIYVDAILGVQFSYILFAYFSENRFNLPFFINLSLALFVLPLIKASGLGLALIAALIISIDWIVKARRRPSVGKSEEIQLSSTGITFSLAQRIAVPSVALISSIIGNYSWSLYRSVAGTSYAWRMSNLTWSSILDFLQNRSSQYMYDIPFVFFRAFFTYPISNYTYQLTYFQWALLLGAVFFICFYLKKRIKNAYLLLVGGGVVYALGLLVLYIFTYSEYEATNLASFERYISTFLLGVMLFIWYMIIFYQNRIDKSHEVSPNIKTSHVSLIVLLVFLFFTNYSSFFELIKTPTIEERRATVTISKISDFPMDYLTDKIYYVRQNSQGFEKYVAEYEITPIPLDGGSIGTPYHEADIWTRNITCNEWLDILNEYTYVYLEYIDGQFIEEFADAFEDKEKIRNNALYEVRKDAGGLKLIYIEL